MINKRHQFSLMFFLAYLVPLFLFRSWKLWLAPTVDGVLGTNEIYVALLYIVCGLFTWFTIEHKKVIKVGSPAFYYILFFVYVVFSNLCFVNQVDCQNIYAIAVILIPMGMSVIPQRTVRVNFRGLVFFVSIIAIIYATLGILYSLNRSGRVNLPLGVSTTVVYFYLVAIPVINLSVKLCRSKLSRTCFFIGLWLTVIASFLTLSRAGSAVVLFLVAMIIFNDGSKNKISRRVFGIILLVSILLFVSSYFDISRLISGFSDNSTSERVRGSLLGLEIFKNNFLIGCGNGTYFERLYTYRHWTDKLITVYNTTGYFDPHNLYVLLLSENGFTGFILFCLFFKSIINRIRSIQNIFVKNAGIQLCLGILIYSFASSDLMNLVGISMIVWLLLGLFVSYSHYEKEKLLIYEV